MHMVHYLSNLTSGMLILKILIKIQTGHGIGMIHSFYAHIKPTTYNWIFLLFILRKAQAKQKMFFHHQVTLSHSVI